MTNWLKKNYKFVPLIALVAMSAIQYYDTRSTLERYRQYFLEDQETLVNRMRRDNVPHEISEHIIYVHKQAEFNMSSVIRSVTLSQLTYTSFVLCIFFVYFSKLNRKPTEEAKTGE